jgi:sugar phosphate isomerase/epimerase
MIYVSSASVKNGLISESVRELAEANFSNIELTGGTQYYEHFARDLFQLKDTYSLNFLCHNYFPPPKNPFVLNLASLNNQVHNSSMDHLKRAIEFSTQLGASRFAFHAGFFVDIPISQIGAGITESKLFDPQKAVDRFCESYIHLDKFSGQLNLYIENNVISARNYHCYNGVNPFMLTNVQQYNELKGVIDFNLLLDVGHLKVSSNALSLDFEEQCKKLICLTDYIHLSDNDALEDKNNEIKESSDLLAIVGRNIRQGSIITMEVYDGVDAITSSYDRVLNVIKG